MIPPKEALAALPGPLLVAVSGGADSAALAHILRQARADVRLAHVNHHLQPCAARLEGAARSLSRLLALPLRVVHLEPDRLRNTPHGLEAAARVARTRALASVCPDASAVLTAHTADDHLETLLLRLLQGTSLAGLGGPRPRYHAHGVRFLRPLLGTSRETLRRWAAEHRLPWVDDPMNADPDRLRSAIRSTAGAPLWALARNGPHGPAPLLRSLARLREDVVLHRALVAAQLEPLSRMYPFGALRLERAPLARLSPDLRRAILAEALRRIGARPSRQAVEALDQRVDASKTGSMRLPGAQATLGDRTVRLAPTRVDGAPGLCPLAAGAPPLRWGRLEIGATPEPDMPPSDAVGQLRVTPIEGEPLAVRAPRDEDLVIPGPGRPPTPLLRRLARDGWPLNERVRAPVLLAGGEVVAVLGAPGPPRGAHAPPSEGGRAAIRIWWRIAPEDSDPPEHM